MTFRHLTFALPLGCLLVLALSAGAQTTILDMRENVYGANIGWINARADNQPASGLRISEHVCSGYIYSANVGWINLGNGAPADNIAYRNDSASDYGVNNVGDGRLDGFAYGANIGWVKFDKNAPYSRPRYDLLTGKLSGYAYGANVGWINLGEDSINVDATVETVAKAPDTDGDGIADFWELQKSGLTVATGGLNIYTSTSDTDGDGQRDVNEYLANTDPNTKDSVLQIKAFTPQAAYSSVNLLFTTTPAIAATRVYRIMTNTDLGAFTQLGSIFLGDTVDNDTLVNVPVSLSSEPKRFWKVEALRPLVTIP